MNPSPNAATFVTQFERFSDTAYLCPAGVWTIGYGTTVYPGGARVTQGDTCTEGQAQAWLQNDLAGAGAAVAREVKVDLTQNQFDALTSFVYNLGAGALQSSTLLRLLNEGDYAGAVAQFQFWVHGGGRVLPGLVTRRAAEAELFKTA